MWDDIYKTWSLPFKSLQSRKMGEIKTYIKQSKKTAGLQSRV